jgi:hypothetical protein
VSNQILRYIVARYKMLFRLFRGLELRSGYDFHPGFFFVCALGWGSVEGLISSLGRRIGN